MSDQERRREEQRIRDEFEKSKSDREFQKVKDYAVKGAMGIGVVVVLLGVMIFIRNKLEERAKATKLAEERAAARRAANWPWSRGRPRTQRRRAILQSSDQAAPDA